MDGPGRERMGSGGPIHPWDDFLIGPENALAHAGALALARGEAPGMSPLVVFGPAGVGKTRLLAGLVAERVRRRPGAAVAHLDAEAFAAACAEGPTRPEGWAEVRDRFRRLDLLVLDDLPTLGRTPWAWEELAHTLDALDGAGGAVAVASRTGPGGWSGWPARLVSRLTGGLSVGVDRPGPESRRRYLLDQLRRRRLVLASDSAEALAEAADGYRTLDGWLSRFALLARLDPRAAAADLVAEILGTEPLVRSATGAGPDLAAIARAVAGLCHVRVGDLRSATRRSSVAEARHLAIHLARTHTTLGARAIGTYFGGRDPATVRHADRVAALRLRVNPELTAALAALARDWPRPGRPGPD